MYIIEGNIGAGKSTFLKLVDKHLPFAHVKLEPLHNWQSKVYGQSLLANFYQDPKRWAYTLETLAMICRVREHLHEQTSKHGCTFFERSIYSGHYCFTHNSHESGFLNEVEWETYTAWFDFLIRGKCQSPRGFIYLRTHPEIAYERVKKRNRHAEKKITLKYLRDIHEKHEAFLMEKKNILPELINVPVLVLDCNDEFENNPEKLQEHLADIQTFVHKTQLPPSPSETITHV